MPRVSVIIPTYNRAHLVGEAIQSLFNQTYRDFEIIVVDNGSADNTREVLSRYGERIRYLFQQNAGPAAARNTGIRASTGEMLAFLDDDDTVSPTKLAHQVAYLDARPDIAVVYTGWQIIGADGTTLLREVRPVWQGEILKDLLLEEYLFPIHSILIRRECFDRVGLFDETLPTSEEVDLWYRLARIYRFGCIAQPLCQYRTTPNSLGQDFNKLERTLPIILQRVFSDPELPADIAALRDEVYARRYLEFSQNYYARSTADSDARMESARRYVSKALALKPTILEERREYFDLLVHKAIKLESGDLEANLRRMMSTLFSEAANRARLEARLLARLHIILAFRGYRAKRRWQVVRHALQGVMHDPSWLINRGVVSIVLRSLLALLLRRGESSLPHVEK